MSISNALATVVIEPETNHEMTIMVLHGLGADANDLAPVAKMLKLPQARFILPNAPTMPVTCNGGFPMPAWHDILKLDFGHYEPDLPSIEQSIKGLATLLETEQQASGLPLSRFVLMGFSQGGAMALELGLHHFPNVAAVVGLSCYPVRGQASLASLPQHVPKLFLAHGEQDEVVPYAVGQQLVNGLKETGARITSHHYPMGHAICPPEIEAIKSFLESLD